MGKEYLLGQLILNSKKPVFDNNDVFDFSVFNENFNYFVARSIWSHASKLQIQAMLDGFVKTACKDGVFLASYHRASIFKRERDYWGNEWVGQSHKSNKHGIVRHSFSWIRNECLNRKLIVEEISDDRYNFGNQKWLRIKNLHNF